MASIIAHPVIRPRRTAPAAPVEVRVEDDHSPRNDVPGPDERTLARTAAAVTVSLVLLIGTMVLLAVGAGTAVSAVAEWFLSR